VWCKRCSSNAQRRLPNDTTMRCSVNSAHVEWSPGTQGPVMSVYERSNCNGFIVDRILNNISRSSSVFWLLTVDWCLIQFFSLPEQCPLFIVVLEGLDAHTSTLWLWWLPHRDYAHKVLMVVAPDQNQAIDRMRPFTTMSDEAWT